MAPRSRSSDLAFRMAECAKRLEDEVLNLKSYLEELHREEEEEFAPDDYDQEGPGVTEGGTNG